MIRSCHGRRVMTLLARGAAVFLATAAGCTTSSIRYIPAESGPILGYVYGARSERDPQIESQVRAEAARRPAGSVEIVGRSADNWTSSTFGGGQFSVSGGQLVFHSGGAAKITSWKKGYQERWLAILYREERTPPTAWLRRRTEIYEACQPEQSAETCVRVAGAYATVLGPTQEDLRRACEVGVAVACQRLAWKYFHGERGHAKDVARFYQLTKKACEQLQYAPACATLTDTVRAVRKPLPAAERARYAELKAAYDARDCRWGRVKGCPDDQANRERRCRRGQLEHCYEYARLRKRRAGRSGHAALRTETQAEYQRLCALGHPKSCLAAAKNDAQRDAAHAMACHLGSVRACDTLSGD